MVRVATVLFLAMLVLGCADVDAGEDTNPFGDVTAATGTGQATSPASDGESTVGGSGGTTGMPTTEAPTTEAPTTAEASTSGPSSATDDATSTPGDTSGGPGEGELGECIGLGAWETCAQYCEAVLEVCVEGGCDGATVVYYDDVAACTAMRSSGSEATPCDGAFMMGGGVSFGRCCCQ
jgi:hypothetical protein